MKPMLHYVSMGFRPAYLSGHAVAGSIHQNFHCLHYHVRYCNSRSSTCMCYSHAFIFLHILCDCITTSTATWILHVSLHARDLPEELSGKKMVLFLLEGCFTINTEIVDI